MSLVTSPSTPQTTTPRPVFSLWDAVSLPSAVNAAIAIALAVVFAGITAGAVLLTSPTYESQATLAIDQPSAVAQSPDTGIIDKLDRLRLKYAGLADTQPVLGPVAAELGMPLDDLRDESTVVIGPQSLLMFATATASDEADAERRAQAFAEGIAAYAEREQTRNGIPETDRYRFTVIEDASGASKVSPTARTATAAAALAAMAAVAIAYVVLQLATANRRLA